MRKSLISLFAIFGIVLSISAWTTSGAFVCFEDDFTGRLNLNTDGSFSLYANGEQWFGTYTIDSEDEVGPGEMARIYFRTEERPFSGMYIWPTQEGVCVNIDGYLFRRISH